jgi:hypothetical protein
MFKAEADFLDPYPRGLIDWTFISYNTYSSYRILLGSDKTVVLAIKCGTIDKITGLERRVAVPTVSATRH